MKTVKTMAWAGILMLGTAPIMMVQAAEENATSDNKKATTDVTATVQGGDIFLKDMTPSFDFEFNLGKALKSDDTLEEMLTAAPKENETFTAKIIDLRGVDTKWSLQASLDKFNENGNKDSMNQAQITFHVNGQTVDLVAGADAVPVASGGGEGALDTSLAVETVQMQVPVKNLHQGTYTSKINWELADVDTGNNE